MVSNAVSNLSTYFYDYGLVDVLLPFILVFTIVFAVMQKSKILGDKKNFNVVIALVLGILFVAPHITGQYPLGYDPVQVMNNSLPSISLVSVAAIMLLILMGIFSTEFSKTAAPFIAFAALGFVIYIFGASLNVWTGPYDVFTWWTKETTELMIIILIFGVVVWLITKDPADKGPLGLASDAAGALGKLFERK